MIGLKYGTVALYEHEKEWDEFAITTIAELKSLFGNVALDIQHIGSTSIKSICAKPIIDIALAVANFDDVNPLIPLLRQSGFFYRADCAPEMQMLFACGSYYECGDKQTCFIHVVTAGSMQWRNYINFRNYLNTFHDKALEYENLKKSLAAEFSDDRQSYLNGKDDFIKYTLRKAMVWSFLGKNVDVFIDRPIGYIHKKVKYSLTYPINYGYIPGVLGGDGEELDVYVLGVDHAVKTFSGKVIGIVHRENDVEDKLVAAPIGITFDAEEIYSAISFQEKYYISKVEVLAKVD